ncbi:MAG: hypothetical protein MT334_00315 [Candidatus Nitrosopumilus limneticus]|nr:hypothetical protein [Candidatus Nitrosopumilus limneticus]MDA0669531.1 hypothetical protein [Thermoproteota archaeon]MSS86224.1 hypothetical protein [Nitrosopumilus sp.]PHY04434.1 MAG: hypothetical protein CK526_02925 [Nitrososphaerota archaeon]MDA0853782.1 hypothetical protein [Thermoproteota archaeon]
MSDFTPSTPIELQIRKIIFEKFNDVNKKFTNDEVFEILKSNGDVNPSWIIDDTESLFNDICDSRLVRSIAQNFTTIFLKLFELVEKFHCNSCNYDIHLGISEERICPNPSCRSTL